MLDEKQLVDFGLDFNVDLPSESDDKFRVIPKKEYIPDWEEEVARYMKVCGSLPFNDILYTHVEIPKELKGLELNKWYSEQVKRCKEGYNGMCGKMYFFYNFCYIQGQKKKQRPDFRVIDNVWFQTIEACQKSNEWGVICVKRRRVGASWKEAADVLHDCLFNSHFNVGMNSKTERDSIALFNKVKFLYEHLPQFLRIPTTKSNTKNFLDFSYVVKDKNGNKNTKGNFSTVMAVAPTDNAYEGLMLGKWVCDEAGKIKNLATMWQYTEDCLLQETRRVGMPIIFGTAGDIGAEGKDLEYMWRNAAQYKLKKFFFAGWMGLACDEYGNDNKEECIRWIVYERKRREGLRIEELNTFIQKYPLTVPEAFTVTTSAGVGNIVKIKAQQHSLREEPVKKVHGYFSMNAAGKVSWIPDPKGRSIIYEHPQESLESLYLGGCLPAGEQVLTDSGLKNIEDINFSDKLINKDGEYVEIKELQTYNVNDSLHEFKVKNTLRTTKFTSEHPLFVSKNKKGFTNFNNRKREGLKYSHQKFNFTFVKAKDVSIGDWIKYPNIYKKTKNIDFDLLWSKYKPANSSKIDNPLTSIDFWWFIGLWLGDGHTSKHKVNISCNSSETKTINRILKFSKQHLNRSACIVNKGKNCLEVSIGSTQLANFLNNLFGKHAQGKSIPEFIKFIDHKYKIGIIDGLIDSDGCISLDKRRGLYSAEIVSINLKLMEDLQDLLFSVGVISSVSKLRDNGTSLILGRLCDTKTTYRVRFGHYWLNVLKKDLHSSSIKLGLLSDLKLVRNQNMGCFFDKTKDYIYFQIIDKKDSWIKDIVYNFHCETNTFVCRHITTHNCDPADHNDTYDEVSDLCMYIMKRRHGTDPPRIVFEYLDRPSDVTEFYEQAMMASLYYNKAKILIERNRYGMINFFEKSEYKFLLARTPKGVIRVHSGKTMTYGLMMTPANKEYLKELLAKYIEDYYEFIPSYELLDEFLYFGARNTDRAMSFGICLILLEDYNYPIQTKAQAISKIPHFGFKNVNGKITRITYPVIMA